MLATPCLQVSEQQHRYIHQLTLEGQTQISPKGLALVLRTHLLLTTGSSECKESDDCSCVQCVAPSRMDTLQDIHIQSPALAVSPPICDAYN